MTKDQLKAELDGLGIEYADDAKKDELEALLPEAETAPESEEEAPEALEAEEATEEAEEEADEQEAAPASLDGALYATRNIKCNGVRFSPGELFTDANEEIRKQLLEDGALKAE